MAESGNALSGNQWTITKRPQKFDDLYGQDEVVHYFKNIQQTKAPIPNAIWLGGKFGCGKTTIAKIIAKTIQFLMLPTAQMQMSIIRATE